MYAKAVIRHFFGISVANEEELIHYWQCYKRYKLEESGSLSASIKK